MPVSSGRRSPGSPVTAPPRQIRPEVPLVRALGLAAGLSLVAAPAPGADTWLTPLPPAPSARPPAPTPAPAAAKGKKPARPTPAPAQAVPAGAFVSGDSGLVELTAGTFPAGETAVPPERIDRTYVHLGAGRPMPLTGARVDGPRTRLEATYAGTGLAIVGAQLGTRAAEAQAAEFEALLAEAGATAAIEERKKRKETKKTARYVVTESARGHAGVVAAPRMPKGPELAQAADEALGLPLELVLGVPPLAVAAGREVRGTLLLDGKPVPNVPVRLVPAVGPAAQPAVTAADGTFRAHVETEGKLLLAAAVVRRTEKADRKRGEEWKKADWEVQRTSLLLSVQAAPPPPPPATSTPTPRAKTKPKKK